MLARISLCATLIFTLTRCSSDDQIVDDPPLLEPCLASCGKLACSVDAEVNCQRYCDSAVEQGEKSGEACPRDLQILFECQEHLSCLEYTDWYDEVPGAYCLEEEAFVELSCPGVTLR